MSLKFIKNSAQTKQDWDWGTTGRISGPIKCDAKDLVVIEVELLPGTGHNFHKHPNQEEVIYILAGVIEQWVGQEKQMLYPGDSAFIPADGVHASFNIGDKPAKVLAILGPAAGPEGYELVEVHEEEPWNTLR